MLCRTLLVLAIFCFGAPAWACDMRSSARAIELTAYVLNGVSCLDNPATGFRYDEEAEREFARLVNAERVQRGLHPLQLRQELRSAARFHSLDIGVNGYFGHESPLGRKHSDRIAAFDRRLLSRYAAENVAKSERTCTNRWGDKVRCRKKNEPMAAALQELHDGLMNSPRHRANILSEDPTHIAIGVVRSEDGLYVTQLFVELGGTLDRPLPLVMPLGAALPVQPDVPEWSFKRFALLRDARPNDFDGPQLPVDFTGETSLAVRCERLGEPVIEPDRIVQPYEYIYLSGPAFTIGGR